ncbi:MAG: SEL1-like repeat protein [Rhodospirillaceae bacterium]|nr:SEL1-like repeat protein [Rhodospirillaceae bacterium]
MSTDRTDPVVRETRPERPDAHPGRADRTPPDPGASHADMLAALDRVSRRLDRVEADLQRVGSLLPSMLGSDSELASNRPELSVHAGLPERVAADDEDADEDADEDSGGRRSLVPWLVVVVALGLFSGGAWWVFSQPGGSGRLSAPVEDTDLADAPGGQEQPVAAAPVDEPAAPLDGPPPAASPTPDHVAVADGPVAGTLPEDAVPEVAPEPPTPNYAALPDDVSQEVRDLAAAAEAGDGMAQHDLASWYALNADPPDLPRAAYWYEQASDNGVVNATYNLGVLLQRGDGLMRDMPRALALFRQAAAANHSHAQNALGLAYLNGQGVQRDPVEAATWFSTAYANGNARGAYYLGRIFEMGVDGAPDLASAAAWFRVAAVAGEPQALDALERLGVPLEPEPTAVPVGPVAAVPVDAAPGDGAEDAAAASSVNLADEQTTVAEETVAEDAAAEPAAEEAATEEIAAEDEVAADETAAEAPAAEDTATAGAAADENADDDLSRDEIRDIQRLLTDLNYDPGPVDGLMGSRTEAAIAEFQTARGLPETGEPSQRLLDALRAANP